MRVYFLVFVTLLASATPSAALDDSVLSCADQRTTDRTMDDMMADVVLNEGDWTPDINRDPPSEISSIIKSCAQRNFLRASVYPAYFDYSLNRLIRRATAGSLRGIGIRPEFVDRELHLGPGLANPLADQVTTETRLRQLNDQVDAAIVASGASRESLLPLHYRTLAAYIEASSRMYRALAKLPK